MVNGTEKSECLINISDFSLSGQSRLESRKKERLSLSVPKLCLKEGEITAVIGGSGCGKSVLLSLIMGCPAFGVGGGQKFAEFSQFGEPMPTNAFRNVCSAARWRRQLRKHGELFYLPQFFPVARAQQQNTQDMMLQVVEALASRNRILKKEIGKKIRDKFEKYSLTDVLDKNIAELSGGERRRAELIARIVAMEISRRPGLLVLDEPTTGFDPVNAIDFVREVKFAVDELCSDGICAGAVITTHEMKCLDDVVGGGERRERVIDRVCVVHGVHKNDEVNCRVVFDGKVEDVWDQFFKDYKERTFANDGSSLFEQVKGVCEANATERRSHHA